MSAMADLKHCPFCGTDHSLTHTVNGRYQQILCVSCGARGPEVYCILPARVASESWNVRQGPSISNNTLRPYGAMAVVAEQA